MVILRIQCVSDENVCGFNVFHTEAECNIRVEAKTRESEAKSCECRANAAGEIPVWLFLLLFFEVFRCHGDWC